MGMNVVVHGENYSGGLPQKVKTTNHAAHVSDVGTVASSYSSVVTAAAAPATTTQSAAIVSGTRVIKATNLSLTAAEYCLIGIGTGSSAALALVDAETNRDAGHSVVAAGATEIIPVPPNALAGIAAGTEFYAYAWKSASGTPSLYLSQQV